MGSSKSTLKVITEDPNRKVFVQYVKMGYINGGIFGSYIVFTFIVRYRRYRWEISIRYSDLLQLQRSLLKLCPGEVVRVEHLPRRNKLFWSHDQQFLEQRASEMAKYLQDILDIDIMIDIPAVRAVLSTSAISFNPDLGRKGKEGWLRKCSGGYNEKFSRKTGDFIKIWKWRWIVLTDSCIVWYKNPNETSPLGSLQIDQEFVVLQTGRVISIRTGTRRFMFRAGTTRLALEWAIELQRFYNSREKATRQPHFSSYPPRLYNDVKVYTTPKDYFQSLAISLLSAQKEILITSWKNSPGVLLTRPPLPPLRLDQLLQYKAEQGVKIFVLLYKEVEHVGQGNDSNNTKKKLESLSSNIHVIRHPNKLFGGATAVWWSHHEKLVIIDRNIAFVGGIDVAFQRWDDDRHDVVDEDGIKYPGNDYRQPAPGALHSARTIDFEKEANDSDEEMIEVEVATLDDNQRLPKAMSTVIDGDDQPYVEDVVVDFGISHAVSTAPGNRSYRSNNSKRNTSIANSSGVTPPLKSKYLQSNLKETNPHLSRPNSAELKPGDVDDNISDSSSNYDEDFHAPETQEEKAEIDQYEVSSDVGSVMSTRSSFSTDVVQSIRSSVQSATTTISSSISTVSDAVCSFTSQAQSMINSYVEQTYTTKKLKTSSYWETRDMYPRMGWHDVQAVVSGQAARDVAAHFVQRWNHHRLSVGDYSKPIMNDITDDLYSSICARCETPQLFETFSRCPKCNYDLGPITSYSVPLSASLLPSKPEDSFTYIVYSFTFFIDSKLPFRLLGDCPVVVAALISNATERYSKIPTEGNLLEITGPLADYLRSKGNEKSLLTPTVGDIILAINDIQVSHLNSNQIKRFVKRIRKGVSVSTRAVDTYTITFRRHMHEEPSVDCEITSTSEFSTLNNTVVAVMKPFSSDPDLHDPIVIATPLDNERTVSIPNQDKLEDQTHLSKDKQEHVTAAVTVNTSTVPSHYSPISISSTPRSHTPVDIALPKSPKVTFVTPSTNPNNNGSQQSPVYDPICQASAQKEISLGISQLFHHYCKQWDLPTRISSITEKNVGGNFTAADVGRQFGSCTVQVLRSVGKWSIGTNNETSILHCYLETIASAQHFIYIENQFFIGNLVSDGLVQNGIAAALVERILKAHASKQRFRVIIIIPLHPNGDFSSAMKSQHVMHYEYATINRGPNSLFQQLKTRAPDISVDEYIGFYSLRNWGVLNNKVVSDQVYVHDKLLIVDDRILIIGSANINDRSMLGARDSEMAIKIEDSFRVDNVFDGKPVAVGFVPHSVRLKLMKQHLGEENIDLLDILNPKTYKLWKDRSINNSFAYHELDGALSLYGCNSAADYKKALNQSNLRSFLDPATKEILQQIKGYLVDWPQNLFQKDNLAPATTTRVMIPNELWV